MSGGRRDDLKSKIKYYELNEDANKRRGKVEGEILRRSSQEICLDSEHAAPEE